MRIIANILWPTSEYLTTLRKQGLKGTLSFHQTRIFTIHMYMVIMIMIIDGASLINILYNHRLLLKGLDDAKLRLYRVVRRMSREAIAICLTHVLAAVLVCAMLAYRVFRGMFFLHNNHIRRGSITFNCSSCRVIHLIVLRGCTEHS